MRVAYSVTASDLLSRDPGRLIKRTSARDFVAGNAFSARNRAFATRRDPKRTSARDFVAGSAFSAKNHAPLPRKGQIPAVVSRICCDVHAIASRASPLGFRRARRACDWVVAGDRPLRLRVTLALLRPSSSQPPIGKAHRLVLRLHLGRCDLRLRLMGNFGSRVAAISEVCVE